MADQGPRPLNERKRVKVYELRNNDWFDRGTGFCSGQYMDEPKILVESEDHADRTLLETRITKDDGYQKQQDTLIVWTETNGTDMALSFQEAEGCSAIWEFVSQVQNELGALAGPDDALSDDALDTSQGFAHVTLPSPELGKLQDIENIMRMASTTQPGRESLTKFIIGEGYISKLIPLVSTAEDLESLVDLHRLCNIMKTLILLNDTAIIELVVTDEVILGVVGALEYDPDFPSHKANHRHYLSDDSRYKEVVHIEDVNIRKRIHHTYRLQYLKDVVLARILDDPTFSVLNSLIFYNQVDIVQHLQANSDFLRDLFGLFSPQERDEGRKKNAVHFIQQCCAIAKNLQAPDRSQLYTNFIQNGLFQVIHFALRHQDASIRIAGTDVLVAMIDHDSGMMRAVIFKQITEKATPLTDTLIELLLVEVDLGVKAQIADAIKVLLDPQTNNPQANETGLGKNFYDESARKLFRPLKELQDRPSMRNFTIQEVSLFSHLVEILCFFIRQHLFRSKYFILAEGLASRIAQLLSCSEKHLKLTALKFFRTCVSLQDPFYNNQLIQHSLFTPILSIVTSTMPRDNLLNSACLELFEFIKKENIKPLLTHLVEHYRVVLEGITYVDTFRALVARYDQMEEYLRVQREERERRERGLRHTSLETTVGDGEDGSGAENVGAVVANGRRGRWQGVKEMDAREEEYFDTSDDEDDQPVVVADATALEDDGDADVNGIGPMPASSRPMINGGKPLVDYPADDSPPSTSPSAEEAMDTDLPQRLLPLTPSPEMGSFRRSPFVARAQPPERVSEKRRREDEDEDDELMKLAIGHKRRSASVESDAPSPRAGRTRSFRVSSGGPDAGGSSSGPVQGGGLAGIAGVGRRIAMSLGVNKGGDELKAGGKEEAKATVAQGETPAERAVRESKRDEPHSPGILTPDDIDDNGDEGRAPTVLPMQQEEVVT